MSKILLADDEVVFRKTFAKILQEEGMDVTQVDNGIDAIDAVMKQAYDVVILDSLNRLVVAMIVSSAALL